MIIGWILLILVFTVYLKTSCPEVYTADCGEMVATSYVLGIPHPTGYSMYCQLNRFMAMSCPLSNIAHRSAILSALFAAAAVMCFYLFLAEFFSMAASVFGALLLAFSFTFWSQANIQEVYAMHVFFLCLLLMIAGRLYHRFSARTFMCFAFVLGLALTHHLLTAFAVPALLLLSAGPKFRRLRLFAAHLPAAVCLGGLGLSALLYFPVRSSENCAIRWLVCHTWSGFKFHVTGEQFRNMMFNVSLEGYKSNTLSYMDKLVNQTTIIPLLLAGVGCIWLFTFRRRFVWVNILYFFTVAFFFLGYRIIDIEVYYIQSYLPVFALSAAGFECALVQMFRRRRFRAMTVMASGMLVFCIFLMIRSYWMNDRERSRVAYDWGINIYNCIPADALLLTQGWSSPFVFFYLDHVIAYRKDMLIKVDYKGTYIYKAATNNWEIPVVSTVRMEIPGLEETPFAVFGVTYQYSQEGIATPEGTLIWSWMRRRGLDEPSVFLDFHSRALKAKYVMMQGEWNFQIGRQEQGFAKLQEAEIIAESNPLILSNLSGVYFQHGNYTEAERLARKAIAVDPMFYPAYHNLGNALIKLERFDAAIKAFQAVNSRNSAFNHALGRQREALGYAFLQRGMHEEALEEFKRALEVSPFSTSARIGSGIAKMHIHRLVGALEDFNRVLTRNPGNTEALINRSVLFLRLSEYSKAEADLKKLLAIDPEHMEAAINLAVVYSETDRVDAAGDILEKLATEHPDNVTILNNLALVYALQGREDDAIAAWNRSLEVDPLQDHVRKNITRYQIDQKLFWNVDNP